jgi:hypothetical protein
MSGGIVVTGLVTGTHIIEDIKVVVPHKMAVYIPIEKVLRSKDLHRALQQGAIFKLEGGSGLRSDTELLPLPKAPVANDDARIVGLERENHRLMKDLEASLRREEGLQKAVTALQGQLGTVLESLGRIEAKPVSVVVQAGETATNLSEAVGGETKSFIPDDIMPKDAEANIRVQKDVTESTAVEGAASRLRALRRKPG